MERAPTQTYEHYWKITLEYSDFYGQNFRTCLAMIVQFIDDGYDVASYDLLQERIGSVFPKADAASTRKSINQFIKLGFIRPGLRGYHPATKHFLGEQDREKKKQLLSKIVYAESSFASAVTKESTDREINFLINTLQKTRSLTRTDVAALMMTDVSEHPKGYFDSEELAQQHAHADVSGFEARKHNQISYLMAILAQLDGLAVQDGVVTLQTDAQVKDEPVEREAKRDPYLQQIYKNELKREAEAHFGFVACMAEGMPYPSLIASHIKPFKDSTASEAYDAQNGLLLSQTLDGLFDRGYISFEDDGTIIVSKQLAPLLGSHLSGYRLHAAFLTPSRTVYLAHHRAHVFLK